MDDILTIEDVAKRLKFDEKTVLSMLQDGELPGFKLRSEWRLKRDHFERWVSGVATGKDPVELVIEITQGAQRKKKSKPHASERAREQGEEAQKGQSVTPLTTRVSQPELHRRFLKALGDKAKSHSEIERKPLEVNLSAPLPSRIRVYLFNVTRPPGGRPLGEHKVQLIIPGQKRGERANFDQSDGRIVLLAGYAAEEDVFVLWDAGLYADFAWSRNVQVKAATLIEASAGRVAEQGRRLRPTDGEAVTETLLACPPRRLCDALQRRVEITRRRMAQ
ncbi:helix-turn-helix domain-containing protein [uncultured Tateyamaria sp.]|uniref:helix-turn-helix domain-containing protein n=1 Tax=uncultured Tateyamaria sp. TaxID=455651 RepID=UPI00262E6755|nr:helix-turn-helix domain-containing protein [uncultured Tateyamaria sp.]